MVADRYRLERKVGGGRVAAVWRVQDQVTNTTCAIKLLHRSMNDHPEALARFSLEDRLSREFTGDYFPERVGSGSWHSLRYIAWRWYEGESLRSLFERTPKQDVQTVYSLVQETCQALTLVHAAGYAHGDLKPENLFFADRPGDSSRQLKLLGFGVASRLARPLLGSQARRTPGQIVGTPLYLSPDLILGRVPRGGQADLWALAVIVYEALTGRAPFLGADLAEVLEAILERRAARPSTIANLPATFDVWWTQALEQQFATPSDFSTSLARALAPALRSSRTQRSASLPERISPTGQGLAWRSDTASRASEANRDKPGPATLASVAPAAPSAGTPQDASSSGAPRARLPRPDRGSSRAGGSRASQPPDESSREAAAREERPALNGHTLTGTAVSRESAAPAAASQANAPEADAPLAASAAAGHGAARDDAETAAAGSIAEASSAEPSIAAAAADGGVSSALAGEGSAAASPAAASAGADGPAPEQPPASPARWRWPLAGGTAAGLGTSPLASVAPARGGVGGTTAAGLGQPGDLAAARAQALQAEALRAEDAEQPEPPRPERPAQRADASAPAGEPTPQRQSITSTTVAGIGPAALSLMRSREAAASPSAAAPDAAAPGGAPLDGPAAPQASEQPTAQTSPFHDLAIGSRKTLVGIFPPAPPPPAPPPPPAVSPSTAPPPAPAAPAATSSQSLVIAGTPCRSIEVSADDEPIDSVVPLRRLGHSTVPFPRPRAARSASYDDFPQEQLLAESLDRSDPPPQSWRYRTQSQLRVVLTDPDHRPHLVAGVLVCSAAALVIFALGRSPVSGTGMLGQTTGSLSEQPSGTRSPGALDSLGSIAPGSTSASGASSSVGTPGASAANDAPGSGTTPASTQPVRETSGAEAAGSALNRPALEGEELAPGLVVPRNGAPASAVPASAVPAPAAAAPAKPPSTTPAPAAPAPARPAPPPPRATPPSPGALPTAPRAAAAPAPAPAASSPAPRPAPSATPAAPPPRAAPPRKPDTEPPPRPVHPDFDFGI